jgi:microcystin degradation protein MlrC
MRDHDCRIICAMHTPYEPMRAFVDGMSAREGKDGVLHVGLVHGFPWGDHPRTGARSLVITDGNVDQAGTLAMELAGELLSIRDGLNRPHPTIDVALDRALAHRSGPIVLADVADNAGGGAPGDATFLLEAILDRGVTNAVVGIFWDPMAMRICREAGEGATLDLRLGGKYGPMSGAPLDLRVTVEKLSSDLSQRFGDLPIPLGNMAWLKCNGVDVVVNDLRTQTFHPIPASVSTSPRKSSSA